MGENYGNELLNEYNKQVCMTLSKDEKEKYETYSFYNIYEIEIGGTDVGSGSCCGGCLALACIGICCWWQPMYGCSMECFTDTFGCCGACCGESCIGPCKDSCSGCC